MRRLPLLTIALLAAACEPNNAVITAGDYTAYLASSNSLTLFKGGLDLDGFEVKAGIDCRELDDDLKVPDRLPVCDGEADDLTPFGSNGVELAELWLNNDGYFLRGGTLDPWRGEAILTSEGDVQIGFHQRLPGGEDFRFQFVIDPVFQPTRCVNSEDGTSVELAELDGDWLGEWSKEVDSGTLFFLNSGAYQFQPVDSLDAGQVHPTWSLPLEWRAGHAAGKFADDNLNKRPTRYATVRSYQEAELDIFGQNEVPRRDLYFWGDDSGPDDPVSQREDIEEDADQILAELDLAGMDEVAGLPSLRPIVHDNAWRGDADDFDEGLDGWGELNQSWVRIDDGSEFEIGGSLSGEFFILLEGQDSSTRVFVRGVFEVPRLKRDAWQTTFLPKVKAEENDTIICGVRPFGLDDE